jgi:hypothetical protein
VVSEIKCRGKARLRNRAKSCSGARRSMKMATRVGTWRYDAAITVFSGMLASTCIAVLFVPSLFVVLQRWSERRRPVSTPKKTGAG